VKLSRLSLGGSSERDHPGTPPIREGGDVGLDVLRGEEKISAVKVLEKRGSHKKEGPLD